MEGLSEGLGAIGGLFQKEKSIIGGVAKPKKKKK